MMFSMTKSNPFASGQPFRDEGTSLDSEKSLRNGISKNFAHEATVAPAIVQAQSWGTEGEIMDPGCPYAAVLREPLHRITLVRQTGKGCHSGVTSLTNGVLYCTLFL